MGKNYTEASKLEFNNGTESFTIEEINCGSLQRIAKASELMSKNFVQLQKDVDFYKSGYYKKAEEINNLNRRINGYKGKIQQLKNQNHEHTSKSKKDSSGPNKGNG